MKNRRAAACAIIFVLALFCSSAHAQMGYLVGTWTASPMEYSAGDAGKSGETLREVVHVSIPGRQHTVVFLSNEFGHEPLTISAVTLAHRMSGSTTDEPVGVTFGGKPSVVIAPGTRARSDITNFVFAAQSDVVISLFIPGQAMTSVTGHGVANSTNYIAAGDQTKGTHLIGAKEITSWRYIAEVDVGTATQASIVCLGDSITDGVHSTMNANRRWPDDLAARLLADKRFGTQLGVLNEGLGGNRILQEGKGPSAIDRFERDVLDTHGYYANGRRYLIILEGINDIGIAYDEKTPRDGFNRPAGDSRVSAKDLIAAYRYLADRAHANGFKVLGGTLTSYLGAGGSADGEKARQALNQWIRTTKDLDGVADFDKATRDPEHPALFLPAYDSGDHLHPNDAGYKAMADSIDLKLFEQ